MVRARRSTDRLVTGGAVLLAVALGVLAFSGLSVVKSAAADGRDIGDWVAVEPAKQSATPPTVRIIEDKTASDTEPIVLPIPTAASPARESAGQPEVPILQIIEEPTSPASVSPADQYRLVTPVSQLLGQKLPPPEASAPTPAPLREYRVDPSYLAPVDAPPGYAGPSSILPREEQTDPHFVPMEDRWRIGMPVYDRYGNGHPPVDDYRSVTGNWWDPYNLNVLKGDYPIMGQNTFLEITGSYNAFYEYHQVPIPTTPFESTVNPNSQPFFGRPNQFLTLNNFILSFDLFHGDGAFKPVDWRIKFTPIMDINYLAGEELGITNPDVRRGVDRGRTFTSLNEWFVETKLLDTSPNYDFVSMRIGSQPFVSDFRGFIFNDINRAVRLFGTNDSNRQQFNAAFFSQQEKDTNSMLNTFNDRHQYITMGNYYVQDFVFPGYTSQWSVHYNHDDPTFKFDRNNFLVRPDPVGVFQPHTLNVVYLGWTGDGHINRFNINHAFYWAVGKDSLNPIANQAQDVNAQMAAVELSYDRDWARFRTSFLWASGDSNPNNHHATGFDGIFENPNFAGGQFTYWQRQSVRLLGVNLVNRGSLFPDLRSSRIQGQSNFVNPGLILLNFGADFDITPKLRAIANANPMWFDNTAVLKTFVFQNRIRTGIGTDVSLGLEYRPYLSNNVIFTYGAAMLVPGGGFRDIYSNFVSDATRPLLATFLNVTLTF
jgi:hypothetical protein